METNNPIICADCIAFFNERLLIVERLTAPFGLALPGGKQEKHERLSTTASRECLEETGMTFVMKGVLGTYAKPGRDPRGHYVTTTLIGDATGEPKGEAGKTKVQLMSKGELYERQHEFVCDHFEMIDDYFNTTA